jgi:hypothetical protein
MADDDWTGPGITREFDQQQRQIDQRLRELHERVGRQIETQEREREETAANLAHRLEALEQTLGHSNWSATQVKEFAEAKLEELGGQLDRRITTQHREQSDAERHLIGRLDALRDAMGVGDDTLRGHIKDQVAQVGRMVDHAREEARLRTSQTDKAADAWKIRSDAEHQAMRDETKVALESAQRAIDKQQQTNEEKFKAMNYIREMAADRERTAMPREVAEAQLSELRKRGESNASRLERMEAAQAGAEQAEAKGRSVAEFSTSTAIAVFAAFVGFLGLAIAVVLAFIA